MQTWSSGGNFPTSKCVWFKAGFADNILFENDRYLFIVWLWGRNLDWFGNDTFSLNGERKGGGVLIQPAFERPSLGAEGSEGDGESNLRTEISLFTRNLHGYSVFKWCDIYFDILNYHVDAEYRNSMVIFLLSVCHNYVFPFGLLQCLEISALISDFSLLMQFEIWD